MKINHEINKTYGENIKKILKIKGFKQKELAKLLAENECKINVENLSKNIQKLDNNSADEMQKLKEDLEYATKYKDSYLVELTNKYINLISRWVTLKVEPENRNIRAISRVLNVSESYFNGTTKLPIPYQVDETVQSQMDILTKKGYLFKYIDEYLNYDIDTIITNDNGTNGPLFYQIEREVQSFLIARIEGLGISKRKDNNNEKE